MNGDGSDPVAALDAQLEAFEKLSMLLKPPAANQPANKQPGAPQPQFVPVPRPKGLYS